MKKLIATISIFSALGFAVALANTGTNAVNDDTTIHQSADSPGIVDSTITDMPGTADTTSKTTIESNKKTTMNDHWTSARTCTDSNGVVHYRGKSGFKSCVDQMRKLEKEQMGGTLPGDMRPDGSTPNVEAPSTDTNSSDSTK